MKTTIIALLIFVISAAYAQNDVRLHSGNGQPFTLLLNDSIVNQTPQANVVLRRIRQDTLQVKIRFENSEAQLLILYLLDKGRHTSGKEFSFRVEREEKELKTVFETMHNIKPHPEPLVPDKPQPDK